MTTPTAHCYNRTREPRHNTAIGNSTRVNASLPTPNDMDAIAHFRDAPRLLRSGDAAGAERACLAALREHPNHASALHLLGVIALQTGRAHAAVERLTQAISADPNQPIAHYNLGLAQAECGQAEAALACYDRAIALKPDYAAAFNNRGNALRQLGRIDDALHSYEDAIARRPDDAEFYNNRGAVLMELGHVDAALWSFDRAIALNPNTATAHANRESARRDPRRSGEGMDFPALARLAEAHNNWAATLACQGHQADALPCYDSAIELNPDYAEAYSNRGSALEALGRLKDAIASYDTSIALNPNAAATHSNRGNALRSARRLDEALTCHDRAVALEPDLPVAHFNRAVVLQDLYRLDEALAEFDKTIALKPDFAEPHWNKSLVSLMRGDFDIGWREFEWRKRIARPVGARVFLGPLLAWRGRYQRFDAVGALGTGPGRYHSVLPLRQRSDGTRHQGRADGATAITVPAEGPGRRAPAARRGRSFTRLRFSLSNDEFAARAANEARNNSGAAALPQGRGGQNRKLARQTRTAHTATRRAGVARRRARESEPELRAIVERRNIPLRRIAEMNVPGIDFHSLQKGEPAESELAALGDAVWPGPNFHNHAADLLDFADTAALIENLDLVISVDTSTAHLAGALGKPVWILNRYDACWRWLLDRTDSPWYLYRAPVPPTGAGRLDVRVRAGEARTRPPARVTPA